MTVDLHLKIGWIIKVSFFFCALFLGGFFLGGIGALVIGFSVGTLGASGLWFVLRHVIPVNCPKCGERYKIRRVRGKSFEAGFSSGRAVYDEYHCERCGFTEKSINRSRRF